MIVNITLTVRIALYNKATFDALIAQLQLYVFSSNEVKIKMFPVGFLLHFETKVLRYESVFIIIIIIKIVLNALIF